MHLFIPTPVDRILNHFKVGGRDTTNEEHLDVVFDRDKFGIVYPRLFCQSLSFGVYLERYGVKAKIRFIFKQSGFLTLFVNNAVFTGPDALFTASSSIIRQDGPSLLLVKHQQAR